MISCLGKDLRRQRELEQLADCFRRSQIMAAWREHLHKRRIQAAKVAIADKFINTKRSFFLQLAAFRALMKHTYKRIVAHNEQRTLNRALTVY